MHNEKENFAPSGQLHEYFSLHNHWRKILPSFFLSFFFNFFWDFFFFKYIVKVILVSAYGGALKE